MSYWSNDVDGCDFAFDAVGAIIFRIKDRLFKDAENVIAKRYPEQGILAFVRSLRVLGEQFPRNLSVHFGAVDLQDARKLFDDWIEAVNESISPDRIEQLRRSAELEFALFEQRIFKKESAGN